MLENGLLKQWRGPATPDTPQYNIHDAVASRQLTALLLRIKFIHFAPATVGSRPTTARPPATRPGSRPVPSPTAKPASYRRFGMPTTATVPPARTGLPAPIDSTPVQGSAWRAKSHAAA